MATPSTSPQRALAPAAPSLRVPMVALIVVLLGACGGWRRTQEFDGWTLYEMPGATIESAAFEAAFKPALEAVQAELGEFRQSVAVHAWDGSVRITDHGREHVQADDDKGVHDVPGIGPARIQAYHARGGAFSTSGVFIGAPDVGTAVHELVHARLAEEDPSLPLWFEEGLASLLGDGALFEGRWVPDGLACWPLRELREENLGHDEIERLIAIQSTDQVSVRDNVLVHFLGWAVAFDFYRETGSMEYGEWLAELDGEWRVDEIHRRMQRTLNPATERTWIKRLYDPDPGVRMATTKGLWKLRSRMVLDKLVEAMRREVNPQVRASLAINALAAAGEISINWRHWRYLREVVDQALRGVVVDNPVEQEALLRLMGSYSQRGEEQAALDALRGLSRFWQE
ncbi:MAG TPA: HEAT repeat domain-containing protein [Planctomycetota bacterium]|nr:HEAT repeat domain-containing protein [Planctomycetota bacterium]